MMIFDLKRFPDFQQSVLSSSSSVLSFNSSLDDLNLQVDNVSFQSSDTNSLDFGKEKCVRFKCGTNLFILGNLSVLPWASRRKAIEDVKNQLKNDEESHGFISTSYVKPVYSPSGALFRRSFTVWINCVKIFKNLCAMEESVAHFVENEHCIASIAEILDVGKEEEQENSLDILLSLCYQREELCETLMQDSIVSSLVT